MQCKGLTKKGVRCTRKASKGSDYCYQHQASNKKDIDDMNLKELAEQMTEKQRSFADYYITTDNATQSAIKAGYSEKTAKVIGHENLTKPYVKAYVGKRLESKDKKRIASQDEVLEYLTRVMYGLEKDEDIVTTTDGRNELMEKRAKIKDRNTAAKALGERYGLFKGKDTSGVQDIKININTPNSIPDPTKEEEE